MVLCKPADNDSFVMGMAHEEARLSYDLLLHIHIAKLACDPIRVRPGLF